MINGIQVVEYCTGVWQSFRRAMSALTVPHNLIKSGANRPRAVLNQTHLSYEAFITELRMTSIFLCVGMLVEEEHMG